ncbi:MAG: hypothetical protein K6E68_02020 [Lachnospiraceae bacterium]|nr:hypothetical protein [Lachnospiraceae bacterium]
MMNNRLPKQFRFVCANIAGSSYDLVGLDHADHEAISSPKYEEENKWKRRT